MQKISTFLIASTFLISTTSFKVIHPLKMSSVVFSYSEKDKTLQLENRFLQMIFKNVSIRNLINVTILFPFTTQKK